MHTEPIDTRTPDQYRNERRRAQYTQRLTAHLEPHTTAYPAPPTRWQSQLRTLIRTVRRQRHANSLSAP